MSLDKYLNNPELLNKLMHEIKLKDRTEELEEACNKCKSSNKKFVICQGCGINQLKQIFKAQKESE